MDQQSPKKLSMTSTTPTKIDLPPVIPVAFCLVPVGDGDKYISYELHGVVADKLVPLEAHARPEPAVRGVEKIKRALDKRRTRHDWR